MQYLVHSSKVMKLMGSPFIAILFFKAIVLKYLAAAAEVMAKRPQTYRGVELMMKYSEVLSSPEVSEDILEVSNLPEQISKELLELYFESPKSGGCSDGVKNVTLLRPGVAKVLFSSSDSELLFFFA